MKSTAIRRLSIKSDDWGGLPPPSLPEMCDSIYHITPTCLLWLWYFMLYLVLHSSQSIGFRYTPSHFCFEILIVTEEGDKSFQSKNFFIFPAPKVSYNTKLLGCVPNGQPSWFISRNMWRASWAQCNGIWGESVFFCATIKY